MGKLIMAVIGATAGVAAAVFIAARRESKQPAAAATLATPMPEVAPLPEASAVPPAVAENVT